MAIDSDPRRSASHLNLLEHLSGPFRGGATDTPIPIAAGADGFAASVDPGTRWPLLLVGTRAAVGPRGFDVTVTVTERTAPPTTTTTVLHFAPFTEAGACLPAWQVREEVAPGIDCAISIAGAPGGATPIDLLELRVVEGVLGRLLYAIGAEKARLRRQACELFALRRLDFPLAGDADPDHRRLGRALDRLGADLGVPRFADRLAWDGAGPQVVSVSEREPDESYRRRLTMMRRFLLPTRARVEAALQGFVGDGARFAINEANADVAVAMLLLPSPDGAPRAAFLDHLRTTRLVQPGRAIPAARPLPSAIRAALQRVLDRIGGVGGDTSHASFEVPAGAFLAPLLAEALDRVGRCRRALGVTRRWKILRAQDDAGGSRYELGLGVEVEAMPAAELEQLAQKLAAQEIAPGTDPETLALLESLAPKPPAEDPVGRWLLAAAGLRTIHPIAGDRWYLSHFPIYGAVLSAAGGAPLALEAKLHAPGDPGPNAALVFGLADVVRDAVAAGVPAFTQLAPAAATAAIAAAALPSAVAVAALTAAGLRTPEDAGNLARVKAELASGPAELTATLMLDATHGSGVLAGEPQAVAQLARLVDLLGNREIISVLPLASGAGVALVVSVTTLAGAARVHSPRQGFRWYAVPISGLPGSLEHGVGSRNRYSAAAGTSLTVALAVSMVRRDRADPRDCIPPYQVRIQMPPGQLLDLAGYERLMNLLERAVPIGVVVDTSRVRERNVAPAGDGQIVRFTGRLAHTFRPYEQIRRTGAENPDRDP